MKKKTLASAIAALPMAFFALTPGAYADNLQASELLTNNSGTLNTTYNGTSATVSIVYSVKATGNDGCDASDGTSAAVSIPLPPNVTSPQSNGTRTVSFTINACDSAGAKTAVFNFSQTGSYELAPTVADADTSDSYSAGNAKTKVNVVAPSDTTGPVISASLNRTPNTAGWYKEQPTISFTCSDPESTVTSCPASSTITDGGSQSVTVSATNSANLTTTKTFGPYKVDSALPTINGATDRTPNGNGWYDDAVVVSFTCFDALSLIASQGCAGPITLVEGENQSATGTAVDNAGNSASATVSNIDVDLTDPTIHASVNKAADEVTHWFNIATGAPTVSFACEDNLSGLASCTAPVPVGEGSNGGADGTATDNAGNTASDSVTGLQVDLTPPTISHAFDKQVNENGWFNESPTLTFTCRDDLSDIASQGGCTEAITFDEGENQDATGTATDNAGNTASDPVSNVDVDLTDPTIEGSVDFDPATTGWYNKATGAPTVSFACDDDLSGKDECTEDVPVGEGENRSIPGAASDLAGNTADTSVHDLDVDLTDPTITGSLVGSTSSTGWFTTAPQVTFSCDDNLSGVVTCPAPVTVGNGDGVGATRGISDVAGNSASGGVTGLKVDTVAPDLSVDNKPGATLDFGATVPTPTCSATDATSGLDGACTVTPSDNTMGAVGDHSFVIAAKDVAGNTSSTTVAYKVKAHKTAGFYAPVDGNGVLNTIKAGSSVPLKFNVYGGETGREITATSVVKAFQATSYTCTAAPTDDVEITTTGGTQLRYDSTGKQFIQNWQTPKAAGTCYKTTATLEDGSKISALFKLK